MVQISNNAKSENSLKSGSLVDIDIISTNIKSNDTVFNLFNLSHDLEKKIFFNLINNDLLEKHKPRYNDDNS